MPVFRTRQAVHDRSENRFEDCEEAAQTEQVTTKESNSNSDLPSCPYAGKVIAKGDVSFWGEVWKNTETIMHIRPDWHITDKNGKKNGWIGTDAAIRNQETFGNVEPHEILAPFRGDIVAKVFDRGIWVDNEKVGEIVNW